MRLVQPSRALCVLIAADDLDVCTYLHQALKATDLHLDRVVEAYGGTQALRLITVGADVVLCRAGLPCPKGGTLYVALRQDARFRCLPVVLVPDLSAETSAPRSTDPYTVALVPPFNTARLEQAVRTVLRAEATPQASDPPDVNPKHPD